VTSPAVLLDGRGEAADGTARVISIVVVSFNAALRRCLASVYEHQAGEFEVIVVDNASTDGSAEMVADDFRRPGSLATVRIWVFRRRECRSASGRRRRYRLPEPGLHARR
jgi:glycosyltransferase involved in cell wall biosynthesis